MGGRIRVGAVNYLNTKPLIEGLTEFAPGIKLVLDIPSRLATRLANAELDVALIPVIEFFRAGTYSIVPGISIASRGPVLSVTLFSRVPWDQIRSVALDEGSRTSAALTRIILRKRFDITPTTESVPMDVSPEELDRLGVDAVLLIGDRAMRACLPKFPFAFDLGQEWTEWTGLPFVYAIWAVREGVNLREAEHAFARAKVFGLANAGEIAAREGAALELDPGYCRRYLTNIIHYDLGPRELEGLELFYSHAVSIGAAPEGVSLVQYHRPHLVESR